MIDDKPLRKLVNTSKKVCISVDVVCCQVVVLTRVEKEKQKKKKERGKGKTEVISRKKKSKMVKITTPKRSKVMK